MSTETILELVGEVRDRIRKALPAVVPADQVESLTETLFTTLTNGGGSFGDPLGGWVTLVSQAYYLGNWLATHKPGDPAPSPPVDKITSRLVASVRQDATVVALLAERVPELPADWRPLWAQHFLEAADRIGIRELGDRATFFRFCADMMADVDYAAGQKPRPF